MNHQTSDVFGVKSTLVMSYIEREAVDERFNEALKNGKEVIVYGSSKQGKTSLILRHLTDNDYVKVECSPKTQPTDIYKSVLRQENIHYTESFTAETTNDQGESLSGGATIRVAPFMQLTVNSEKNNNITHGVNTASKYIEYNLELAQDVSELLKQHHVEKYLVLENFHYLSLDVQKALAYDLRTFQDNGIIFVILGIWREANHLIQFNGDLLDRISEVPVEPWEKEDFERVIEIGSEYLNVDFSNIKDQLIDDSFDSIGVVQEICKLCCLSAGVTTTAKNRIVLTNMHLKYALEKKAEEYGVRHIRNFESFVDIRVRLSIQSGKPSLAFPYYFIKLLLTKEFSEIQKGLTRATLLDEIRVIHHRSDDVRSGDLGHFLHNVTQHQISKNIQPPFVDYDRAGKVMKVIDSSLYFFLKHCNREEILEDIPNPVEE